MKNLGKNDVKVLKVLTDWGATVNFKDEENSSRVNVEGLDFELSEYLGDTETLEAAITEALREDTPPAGTPNSEITDEQKGMIQLLFEIEKVLV